MNPRISDNFAFLQEQFPFATEAAHMAETHVEGDPRASIFHSRRAVERLVMRVFRIDPALIRPDDEKLSVFMHDPAFREAMGEAVWQKADYIRDAGNVAVHRKSTPTADEARMIVEELFHVMYWAGRTYLRKGAEDLRGKKYDESLIPNTETTVSPASIEALESLQTQLEEQEQQRQETDAELAALREKLATYKTENAAVPETHEYCEATTRTLIIDLALHRAGWPLDDERDREYEVVGMPNTAGVGYADYVLWGDDGKPLAVVEAKKTTVDPRKGQQQAKLYADCLEQMHGQRPIIYYTNGYKTWIWDDQNYPHRHIHGFHKKSELTSLILRRSQRSTPDAADVKDEIANRYYQKRAIGSICEQFVSKRRKTLLVMATGTGKTRTAIALVDLLQRAGWIKRALFLADRVSLVNQAVNAFKAHLPSSSPVNLVTEKDQQGRVYVSTYQSMMGLIDETDGNEARFGVGHFDLVIIDEAHRSVYQKYGAIFEYFDSLLVGLTATPSEQIDRNTYDLFELQPGVPTDAYELGTAVADEFLVPPQAEIVDLRFPREGIDYDDLSDEEKVEWENTDWGTGVATDASPSRVDAAAVNRWLFNTDTVDKVLQHLMENGHTVDGGDRLAKTIVFARNHDHALFIEERFNHHYPSYKGHFARVIDHFAKYPQSLIDDFSIKEKDPHIAISVDMLDTGIDVPEVANLVFFKPVYSKIKFWQMIGRGTRLCPDLHGPGQDKQDFRIFDFCFNFDFFRENPEGIERGGTAPLGTRLFRARVQLLGHVQAAADLDPDSKVGEALTTHLFGEVAAMNRENFIVKMHLEAVERFQDRTAWDSLSEIDLERLSREVAGLPNELESDGIEARQFDLMLLRMQLAIAEADQGTFERFRARVVEMAMLLEEKTAIPAVKAQLEFLAAIQEDAFWNDIALGGLEDVRLRLRDLIQFLDRTSQPIVYTAFEDEVMAVREEAVIDLPRMTSAEYEKKVKVYLDQHRDQIAIHRLRNNKPLTQTDLDALERTLVEIGEGDGDQLLKNLLEQKEAPDLVTFIRSMVGMDRAVAQQAFSRFLSDSSLNADQMRFVELIIEQLTSRGVMNDAALYEAPFTQIHHEGPEALFAGKKNVIEGIFTRLREMCSG